MGMYAEIIAIGSYLPDLKKHLEYPDEFYEKTIQGAPVVKVLFGIAEGSSLSKEFASYLGVTDPWDFNQHKLIPSNFNADEI